MGRGCVAPQSDGEDSSWRFGINRKGCGTERREPGKPQEDDAKSIGEEAGGGCRYLKIF